MGIKHHQKKSRIIRYSVLLFIFLVSTILGLMHQAGTKWLPVGVDALCPFGGLESAYSLIVTGEFVKRTAMSSLILFAATLLILIFFGRSFCGNICPLGFLQEIFGKLAAKLKIKKYEVPKLIDKPARFLKYIIMIIFLIWTYRIGDLAIREYDPWAAYHHLFSGAELFEEFPIGFAILIISLIGSIFYKRFFCKYLCPMGAFLGLLNRIGLYKIKRNEKTCINCSACSRACPVNIPVDKIKKVVSSECLSCNECVNSCPVENTLIIEGPAKNIITALKVTIVTFAIFMGVIAISTAAGQFKWSIPKLSDVSETTEKFNPDDIKGRYTFKELSEATGVSKEDIMNEFNLTEKQFNAPIKDVTHAEGSEIETEDVRNYIRNKLGMSETEK